MLPAVSDDDLITELRAVVTAGWRLPAQPQHKEDIRHLLSMAKVKSTESYSTTARHLLEMLDETLIRCSEDLLGRDGEPLLSEEQSHGLRILFGLPHEYRPKGVDLRRREGGALYLGLDTIKPDTFYRSYERDALRVVLSCLKAHYGQEQAPSRSFESVVRRASAVIGTNQRIRSVRFDNVYRSKIDGLDFVRTWFYLREPEIITKLGIEDLVGVKKDYDIQPRAEGAFRLTFQLSEPAAAGKDVPWGYTRTYEYADTPRKFVEDRIGFSARNDGYLLSATVRFECKPPPLIWTYSRRKQYYEIDPPSESLTPQSDGSYAFPETIDTSCLQVYGIAWRW